MRRVCHILQPNKKITYPQHFLFFDTETTQVKIDEWEVEHKFRLGVACYWRNKVKDAKDVEKYFDFNDPNTFWDLVEQYAYKNKTLYVIAHNIDFDMKVLGGFGQMRQRGYQLTFFINNGLTKIWRYHNGQRRIVFLDNMNFFSGKLERVGQDIGLKKYTMPEFKSHNSIWSLYCKRDVEIMVKAWQQFLNFIVDNDLGTFKPTIASQSFNAFRHRFMSHKITIHNDEEVTELERESYHGGRCECFFIGKAPVEDYYLLDINSMYPFMMKTQNYPVKFLHRSPKLSFFELERWLKKYCVIARVKVKMSDPIFSTRINKKLCFPTGTFETVLTTNELKEGLRRKSILEIREAVCYEAAPIFKTYVEYFYQKRLDYKQEGNATYSFITKLFMNSLYGKFGQKNDVWKFSHTDEELESGYWNEFDGVKNEISKFRCIEGRVEEQIGQEEAYNAFAAVASEVTANARLLLWGLIEKAGKENVFYCDTDSLIVNLSGFVKLSDQLSDKELGRLKLVKKSRKLIIFAPKYYRFGQDLKIKGVKSTAEKIDDYNFVDWQFIGVKGALRRKELNKQVMIKIPKSLKQEYTKGRVLKSGRVVPFNLTEICPSKIFN